MPSRIIRDGIIESVAVNALPWEAELFYRRLMSVVDDYGRYSALPQLLVSRCYPLQVDKVKTEQIATWLGLCAEQDLITLYECDKGKPLLEINQFNQRTRTPSKFAENPKNSVIPTKRITNDSQMTVEDEDEVECEDVIKPKTKQVKRASLITEDWKPNDQHVATCEELGVDIVRARQEFIDWALGGGKKYVCWDRTFSRAIRGWLGEKQAVKVNRSTTLDPLGNPIKKWR